MKILAIDTETIPNQSLPENFGFDPDTVKVGNMKDPAKIQVKLDEAKEKHSKTMSLDPAMCQLCTFCGITYDTETHKIINEVTLQVVEADKHDDLELVSTGWNTILMAHQERMPIISFNGIQFDLPVMLFRAIAQDVPVSPITYKYLTQKYNNKHHYDVMQILAGWDRQKWHKQDFYLNIFKLGSKDGFDGSMVYPTYQSGEYETIKQYCRNDVLTLCKLFTRVEPWFKVEIEENIGGK